MRHYLQERPNLPSARSVFPGKESPQGQSFVQYPLSRDEHAAMTRYLSGIRKQLQDVSDLFTARYGKDSNIAELAVRTLVSSTLLEHELTVLESEADEVPEKSLEGVTYTVYSS